MSNCSDVCKIVHDMLLELGFDISGYSYHDDIIEALGQAKLYRPMPRKERGIDKPEIRYRVLALIEAEIDLGDGDLNWENVQETTVVMETGDIDEIGAWLTANRMDKKYAERDEEELREWSKQIEAEYEVRDDDNV
jgi:hypothetical protein